MVFLQGIRCLILRPAAAERCRLPQVGEEHMTGRDAFAAAGNPLAPRRRAAEGTGAPLPVVAINQRFG
jgi:hypothetical protein